MASKPIEGYEDAYEIHDDGTIWSKDRTIWTNLNTQKRHFKGRQLKVNTQFRKNRDKYGKLRYETKKECSITLTYLGKKPKTFYIHRLVAKAFIPNPYHLPEVNHIDGNPENNDVSNLEWCTTTYNQHDAYVNGWANGKVIKLIDKNKHVHEFSSHEKANDFLNLDIDSVIRRYPKKRKILGYIIELPTDDPKIQYDYDNFERGWKSVTVISPNGETKTLKSQSAASRYMGQSERFLSYVLRRYPTHRMFNGYKIKLASDDNQHQYNYDNIEVAKMPNRAPIGPVKVILKDYDGTLLKFYSYNQVDKFLGKSYGYVARILQKHPKRRNLMGYILKLTTDSNHRKYDYHCYDIKTTITVTDNSNQIRTFKTFADVARYIGIRPTQMQSFWGRQSKNVANYHGYQIELKQESY